MRYSSNAEKVFSIFEPYTVWISKGKAGVPVELGVKVRILEDQHQFILHMNASKAVMWVTPIGNIGNCN